MPCFGRVLNCLGIIPKQLSTLPKQGA